MGPDGFSVTVDRGGELVEGFRAVTSLLAAARDFEVDRSAPLADRPLPVTILTGFLGSGKTTVLRHLLTSDHGLRLAAVVNDLGAVNIDALAIAELDPDDEAGPALATRYELSNGCACCALGDDLAESLRAAGAAEPAPDAVVVEASGAADAVSMAVTVESDPTLHIDGIVCVIDAEAWVRQLAHPTLGRLVRRQIEAAHIVLVSKTDLVPSDAVDATVADVARLAPGRRVVPVACGRVEPAIVLGAALRGAALRPPPEPHHLDVITTTLRLAGPLDIARLSAWLEAGDHRLLRAKGHLDGDDGGHHELQVVGRRWTLTEATGVRGVATIVIMAQDEATVAAAVTRLGEFGPLDPGRSMPGPRKIQS